MVVWPFEDCKCLIDYVALFFVRLDVILGYCVSLGFVFDLSCLLNFTSMRLVKLYKFNALQCDHKLLCMQRLGEQHTDFAFNDFTRNNCLIPGLESD